MMSLSGRWIAFWNTSLVKRGRKNKVEYLIKFVGHGPEHNLWQADMSNCADSVTDYWALKPEFERLVVMLSCRFTR